jgi:DDE superfamily endonuclease
MRAQERGAIGSGDGTGAGSGPASIALHFVGASGWSDERVMAKVREMVLPEIERHGAIQAWIIDDTSFPPLRPERHIQNSIATMRRRLIAALIIPLPRCPCCAAPIAKRYDREICDAVRRGPCKGRYRSH